MQPNAAHRLAQAALETWSHLSARVADGEPADVALQAWWRTHRHYGSRDRRFISESSYSYFRWKGWLDAAPRSPAATLALAYLLDATEPHASATALLGEAGLPVELAPAGTLDATGKADWLAQTLGLDQRPPLARLVPEWVASTMTAPQLDRFVASIQQRPPLWLRTKMGDAGNVMRYLSEQGFPAQQHPRHACAVSLTKTPPSSVIRELERRGCTPQDLSSQAVGLICNPKAGQHWWDMCAGAGGKTLHLAELMEGRGRILATDIRESALEELDRRARAMRMPSLQLRLLRPDAPPPGGPFDGVLVDAPCSGLGTWGRNPDARWRTSLETVERSAATQLSLLDRAARHAKPAGRLIFATCSVTRQEGPAVVESFLATHPAWHCTPISTPFREAPPEPFLTIWPHDHAGIGMFIAHFKMKQ